MNKLTKTRGIGTILLLLILILFVWYIGPHDGIQGADEYTSEMEEIPSYITNDITEEVPLTQNFIPQYGFLKEIGLVFFQTGEEAAQGKILITLTDDKGNVISEKKRDISEVDPGEWYILGINKQVKMGQLYHLTFTTSEADTIPKIMVVNSAFDVKENQNLQVDKADVSGGVAISYNYKTTHTAAFRYAICLGMILIFLLMMGYMWLSEQTKKKIYDIFVINGDLRKAAFYMGMAVLSLAILYLHLYKLEEIPRALNIDELGMSYDAWSLANFGVDRYLKEYPLYLINYGGQSALYAYIEAVLIKIFGYSHFLIRVPAIINAYVIFIFGALIAHRTWKKRSHTLAFSALFAIMPVFLFLTRIGLDCNLMLGLSTAMMYFLMLAVEDNKKRYFVISGVLTALVLYAYVLSYFSMIFFIILVAVYLLYLKKINWKHALAYLIPLGILAFPLVAIQVINIFDLPEVKLGCFTLTKLPVYRTSELSLDYIVTNLFRGIKYLVWEDGIEFESAPGYHNMYLVSIPFLIIGFCKSIYQCVESTRKKEWNHEMILLFWIGSILLTGTVLGEFGPTVYKLNGVYFVVLYLVAKGIFAMAEMIINQNWVKGVIAATVVSYALSFVCFTEYYFHHYTEEQYPNYFFQFTYEDAIAALNSLPDDIKNRTTYISEYKKEDLTYFISSLMVSPLEFPFEEYYDNDIQDYENYHLERALQVVDGVNYILQETDQAFAIKLEKSGYIVQEVGHHFLCYKM